MPDHTHSLDTFWESTVSHSSLAGNARSHSPPGQFLRQHCQLVHSENARSCSRSGQRALSASQFSRKCQVTLTFWTHFDRALSTSPVWQVMPCHSHTRHILREHHQTVQFGRKCHITLTSWTHTQAVSHPVWQAMPDHTHILNTFWQCTVRQSSLAENAGTHSLNIFATNAEYYVSH